MDSALNVHMMEGFDIVCIYNKIVLCYGFQELNFLEASVFS